MASIDGTTDFFYASRTGRKRGSPPLTDGKPSNKRWHPGGKVVSPSTKYLFADYCDSLNPSDCSQEAIPVGSTLQK